MLLVAGCPPTKPVERVERGDRPAHSSSPEERRVAVTVDGEVVTRSEVERRIRQLPEYARLQYRTPERKKSYLESIVRFEIMADVAESRGLGEHPAVRYALEKRIAEQQVHEALRTSELSMDAIDDQVIREAYEASYARPERRRVAIIAGESRARLASLRADLDDESYESPEERTQAFRQAASRYSNHPSAPKGGDIGWVHPPDDETSHRKLAEVVYELDPMGALSAVFEYEDGWALATYYQSRPATNLEERRREIQTDLYEERKQQQRERILERWRDETSVSIRRDVIEGLTEPAQPRTSRLADIPLVRADEGHDSTSGDTDSP